MKTYNVPHTDLVVSRLAYGLGMLGDVSWRSTDFVARSVAAARVAYENGITLFDTADIYAEGQSEAVLAELLRASSIPRNKIVIQTKCGIRVRPGWAPGDPVCPGSLTVDLSHDHIVSAVEASLKRVGTDRLDVLLLHSPSALMDPEEIARAFDRLHRSGKVRYFGVCTHNALQIELLKKNLHQRLIANQIWLSLAHSIPIKETSGFGSLVDYCRLHEIQVQAFSPMKGNNIFNKPMLLSPPTDPNPKVDQLPQLLAEVAKTHNTTPAAIMLAWLLRHPVGIVPIIGATKPEHIIENCRADDIEISLEEWQILLASAA